MKCLGMVLDEITNSTTRRLSSQLEDSLLPFGPTEASLSVSLSLSPLKIDKKVYTYPSTT